MDLPGAVEEQQAGEANSGNGIAAETQLVKEEPFVPLAQPQSLRDAQPKPDGAVENGPGNVADFAENASVRTPSSNIDDKDELEALLEILTEAFNEVDLENSGVISTEQLGIVLEGLVEEGVIDMYTDEELDMLANDMDVERNGFIPLEEFKDVLVRRQDGYDFTDMEIKEAFSVLDVSDSGTVSVKELRAVMLACCDVDVRFAEGKKMIEAASRTGEKGSKATIKFEEFEGIIHWRPDAPGGSSESPH